MKIISLSELTKFQDCEMQWLYQYVYDLDYILSTDELFVQIMRETLMEAMTAWVDRGFIVAERIHSLWIDKWLPAGYNHGLRQEELEHLGSKGYALIKDLIHKLTRDYVIVEGPLTWLYQVPELDIGIQDTSLALLRKKRKQNGNNAYFVLEIFPSSYRFWNGKIPYRILQVAYRACIKLLEGSEGPNRTAGTLAVHTGTGEIEVLSVPSNYIEDQLIVDTLLERLQHLSIKATDNNSRCQVCPYTDICSMTHLNVQFFRPTLRNNEEVKKCLTPNITTKPSYSISPAMRERIMGYRSRKTKVE
jgi:CRISPR/Cas system-associated exonuclease Cas4 (RecB family)